MTTLVWGIKTSLIAYVRAQGDDAVVAVTDGARETPGGFAFPAGQGTYADGRIDFGGAVRISAHEGMMNIPVVAPRLLSVDGTWELTIPSPDDPEARLSLVTVGSLEPQPDGTLKGSRVALSASGAALFFFGPYGQGTPFDDLTVVP